LLLIAVWVGSVSIAGWLVLDRADCEAPALFMSRLSRVAGLALAGIVATGIYAAFHRLDSPVRLVESVYGAVLLLKLLCVGVAVALGGWNRFIGFPAGGRDGWARARLVLRIESVFLLAALAAAAVLTMQQPPQ
jgi:putative copper resistance protein D